MIEFPSFSMSYNTHTAYYSKSVCIEVFCSTDNRMATVTLLELETLNMTDRMSALIPSTEAEFMAAYKRAQNLITAALFANHSTVISC